MALPRTTPGTEPAWHLYVVSHPEIETIRESLTAAGVGCRAYYRTPVHLQPPMRPWAPAVDLPGTEEAARNHLAIPMSPVLSDEQAEQVVAAVQASGVQPRPLAAGPTVG